MDCGNRPGERVFRIEKRLTRRRGGRGWGKLWGRGAEGTVAGSLPNGAVNTSPASMLLRDLFPNSQPGGNRICSVTAQAFLEISRRIPGNCIGIQRRSALPVRVR